MASAPLITTDQQLQVIENHFGSNPFESRNRKNSKAEQGLRWSRAQRAEKEAMLRDTGKARPAVVVNFNPFALRVSGGMLFKDGVAACPVGTPYSARVLHEVRWQAADKGCTLDDVEQFDPIPYVPAVLAPEYVREYVQERQTGGVLVFMGDGVPEDLDVEVDIPQHTPGGDGPSYTTIIKRNLKQYWEETLAKQNAQILKRIEEANTFYEDPEMRKYITDNDREYVRLAEYRGILKPEDRPRWVLNNAMLHAEKKPDPCPACGAVPNPGAAVCITCGDYVFDRVKAFRAGVIEIEHRSMADATDAEWSEIQKIHKRRERIKEQRTKAAN